MLPFTMTVSEDGRFRAMALEVAGKYVEMAGGAPADVLALTGALSTALDELSSRAPGSAVDLRFEQNGHGLEVTLSAGASSSVVHQPILAKKG